MRMFYDTVVIIVIYLGLAKSMWTPHRHIHMLVEHPISDVVLLFIII